MSVLGELRRIAALEGNEPNKERIIYSIPVENQFYMWVLQGPGGMNWKCFVNVGGTLQPSPFGDCDTIQDVYASIRSLQPDRDH